MKSNRAAPELASIESNLVKAQWGNFLIELALARGYPIIYSIGSFAANGMLRNPILERLLPGLLQIKAVAILDAALKGELKRKGGKASSKKYKDDLAGRISLSAALGLLRDVNSLKGIRDTRNSIAHEVDACIGWAQLDSDVNIIHESLSELGLVVARPVLTMKADRTPRPADNGANAAFGFDYCVSVLDGTITRATIRWSETISDEGAES